MPGPEPQIFAACGKQRLDRSDMLRDRAAKAEADADAGAGQVRLAAHLDGLAVQKGTAAAPRRIELARERVIDDPEHQFTLDDQPNGHAPYKDSGQ